MISVQYKWIKTEINIKIKNSTKKISAEIVSHGEINYIFVSFKLSIFNNKYINKHP